MNAILDAVDFGLLLIDSAGLVHKANRWIRERSRASNDLAGHPLACAFKAPVDPHLARAVRSCLDLGNSIRLSQAFHPMPLPLYRPDEPGDQRMRQAVDVTTVRLGEAHVAHCLIQVRDMTELVKREQLLRNQSRQLGSELLRLKAAHEEIERQSLRFREIARTAPVALFETDKDGLVTYCNARACEMLSLEAPAALHTAWTELFVAHVDNIALKRGRWLASATTGLRYCDEFCLERSNTTPRWVRIEASAIRQADGVVHGHIFTLVDVTEFRIDAQRNEYRANHDPLTGLANRERFDDRLQHLLADAGAEAKPITVMFIDLDRFKAINDTHGHQAGDAVLKAIGSRIRRAVRAEDVVARLGGDEFAVLIQEVSDRAVLERIANKIGKAISMPINVGTCHVYASASIGWACSGTEGTDRTALVATADAAMYRAKRHSSFMPA